MWDLVPQPGIEPGPPALGARSLSHWITKEVLKSYSYQIQSHPWRVSALEKSFLLTLFLPVILCCQKIIIQQPWSPCIAGPLSGFYCIHVFLYRRNSFILQVLILGSMKNILVCIFWNKYWMKAAQCTQINTSVCSLCTSTCAGRDSCYARERVIPYSLSFPFLIFWASSLGMSL